MNEELSSMVDGELDDAGLASQLSVLRENAEARAAWDTFHLIGDTLRGDIAPDICSRVTARLAAEPTQLVPVSRARKLNAIGAWAMSLAAGAAAVALVVWTVLPGFRGDLQVAQNAPIPQMPATAAPATSPVADYLLAHQRYSTTNAMQGVAPYVRTVADESEPDR
jgi:sigma-E factor negative regulatory protein RseA